MLMVRYRDNALLVTRNLPSASDDAFRRLLNEVRLDESVLELYDRRLAKANAIADGRVNFDSIDVVNPQQSLMQEHLKQPWERHAEAALEALSQDGSGDSEAGYGSSGSSVSYGMPFVGGMYYADSTSSDIGMHTGNEDAGSEDAGSEDTASDSDDEASATSHITRFSDELSGDYIYGLLPRRDSLPYANDAQASFNTEVQDCWDRHCDRHYNHLGNIEQWAWSKAPEMSAIGLNLDMDPAVSMEYMYIRKSRLALRRRVPKADESPVPNYCACARNQSRSLHHTAKFERLSCDCLPPPLSESIGTE